MRASATLSAILAASAVTEATVIATQPSLNTIVTLVPPPLSTGHTKPHHHHNTTVTAPCSTTPFPISSAPSGAPISSANSTGIFTSATGLPPSPTASNTNSPTAGPTGGASLNAQNSFLAMGVAVVMAVLTL